MTKGRKPLSLFMPLWPKCIQWNPWSRRPPWWETTLLSRPLFQKPLQVYCLQNIIGSKIHESVYYDRDQNICDCANIVTEKLTCMQVHKLGQCGAYCLRLSALCQLLSDVNIEMCILHSFWFVSSYCGLVNCDSAFHLRFGDLWVELV